MVGEAWLRRQIDTLQTSGEASVARLFYAPCASDRFRSFNTDRVQIRCVRSTVFIAASLFVPWAMAAAMLGNCWRDCSTISPALLTMRHRQPA
jgi:hypothetical protein